MPDFKPGMLVKSKYRAADIQKHKIGLVIAVHGEEHVDVIWSGQTNPTTVKLKYIVPLEECEDA